MAERPAAIDREELLTLRRQVRFQDGRPYDARCSTVAASVEARFGFTRQWGRLRLLDGRVCWQHSWNKLPDGTILDVTADQFEADWLGDIVVLAADDPHAAAYQRSPVAWTFTLRERGELVELHATPDEPAREEIACVGSWFEATRRVLRAMTGWELSNDVVDYAARALWVRASLGRPTTSGELDGLLTMYEWAYRTAARGRPWMAPEYVAIRLEGERCRGDISIAKFDARSS